MVFFNMFPKQYKGQSSQEITLAMKQIVMFAIHNTQNAWILEEITLLHSSNFINFNNCMFFQVAIIECHTRMNILKKHATYVVDHSIQRLLRNIWRTLIHVFA